MVEKSWLEVNRKKVITHTAIIVGFILFTIFLAEPLFNIFERIPGEAQVRNVSLPDESNNIIYEVTSFYTDNSTGVEIRGWAFIDGQDTDDIQIYIVLKSNDLTFTFNTQGSLTETVTSTFNHLALNLDHAGFSTIIPTRTITNGDYTPGIYIEKNNIKSLVYMDKTIVINEGNVRIISRLSTLQEPVLPVESQNMRSFIDSVENTEVNGMKSVEIKGWAFIEGHSAENSRIYVVLKSDSATYIFDTVSQRVPEVTARFESLNLNLDHSGFIARIPVEKIGNGTYILGIYVKKGDFEALQYADRAIIKAQGAVNVIPRLSSEVKGFHLVSESQNLRYYIDSCMEIMVDELKFQEIKGWAFIEGHSAENSRIYVVLKSDSATYIFDTVSQRVPEVTARFESLNLNLDHSGFIARIPMEKIGNDTYILGIYVKKGDFEALQYADRAIIKAQGAVNAIPRLSSEVKGFHLVSESQNLRYYIDSCMEIMVDELKFQEIKGWAFIEGHSAENSRIYVMLKSDTATYIFDTVPQRVPEVTAYFKSLNLNLDHSGFIARIPMEKIGNDTYILGIYVKKGDFEALQYSEQKVLKD